MSADRLADLIAHARSDPALLGHTLAAYQEERTLSDAELAYELEMPASALTGLRLCWRPEPESKDFDLAVRQIALSFRCSAERLAEIVRRAAEPGKR